MDLMAFLYDCFVHISFVLLCSSRVCVCVCSHLPVSLSLQDVLDWALSLAAEGDGLIESAHYAEDSILPKCSELRAVCDEVTSFLKTKKVLLLRAMELHHCLEKVRAGGEK